MPGRGVDVCSFRVPDGWAGGRKSERLWLEWLVHDGGAAESLVLAFRCLPQPLFSHNFFFFFLLLSGVRRLLCK